MVVFLLTSCITNDITRVSRGFLYNKGSKNKSITSCWNYKIFITIPSHTQSLCGSCDVTVNSAVKIIVNSITCIDGNKPNVVTNGWPNNTFYLKIWIFVCLLEFLRLCDHLYDYFLIFSFLHFVYLPFRRV